MAQYGYDLEKLLSFELATPTCSATTELVRVVIDSNWSFRTVERPSFHRFLRFLRPDTVIISRCKFKTIFKSQHEEAKRSILRDLGKSTKISIALDAWSAANHLCFLAVKGYYINKDWKLQEKLLDFLPMRGRHTGTSMADEVLHILLDTKTKTQLLAITCDNASNNSVLARTLQSKLQEVDIQWSARENTIPCLAHIINLVVQDIIQHLRLAATTELGARDTLQRRHIQDIETHISVPNSLRKIRAICIAIDVSPQRFERFIAVQQHLPPKERLCRIPARHTSTIYDNRRIPGERSQHGTRQQQMASETASSNGGCTLTREELLGTTNLKAREWRHIDPKIWDDEIEAPDDEVDGTAATTYIARAIADYTDRPTADAELFGEFCQDFEGWTEAMFMRAHATYTKELKRILRFKGVYTGRVNMPPSEAVAKLLHKEDCPKWPDDQFQSTAFDERSAAYMLQQRRLLGRHTTGSVQPTNVGTASRAQSQTSARARDQDAEDQQTDVQDETRTRTQTGDTRRTSDSKVINLA
ncbi:hypothetical protein Ptr86124_012119 [Pyrenophora tritici-repentis]|uniref:Uncharacterized protein n=2 Tax=Pyrenophora tritici-repentis TaxID=45151 RepID=A0A922N488_9PLEO|nr:hypothetical protein Ptr86124_012119 [Pyrenophora tritici-repentis]